MAERSESKRALMQRCSLGTKMVYRECWDLVQQKMKVMVDVIKDKEKNHGKVSIDLEDC